MNKSNKIASLVASRKSIRLAASLIVTGLLLPSQMALAGPCEDAQEYYRLWRETDATAARAVGGNPANIFAGLRYVGTIARYKALYDKAAAECARLQSGQVTEPKTQPHGNRGYGPARTGLDWKPFLADLRPRALASQLRQGDNYANKGDWDAAARCYDLAARIAPNNQRALQKAESAHQKSNQTAQPAPAQPAPPETGTQPQAPAPSPLDTLKPAPTEPATPPPVAQPAASRQSPANVGTGAKKDSLPPDIESAYKQNPSQANTDGIKNGIKKSSQNYFRIKWPDEGNELGK